MSTRFANRFEGKVALLTGSAATNKDELMGFGGATVWRFLEEGGKGVVITDVQDEVGERSAQQLRDAGHDAIYMHLDVTEEDEWTSVVDATMKHFGRLDVLVNIAGILDPKSILDIEPAVWKKTMEISTVGIFLGTRAVAEPMEKSGGGSIINQASVGGLIGIAGIASYAAAKAGVIGLTKQMAVEYGPSKIRVNAICPGTVPTPLVERTYREKGGFAATSALGADATYEEILESSAQRYPIGRLGMAEEIASFALYLASDESAWTTGAIVPIDGGMTAA